MSATDERICDTCGNDHCSYGGHGLAIHGDPKDMCEHYQPMTATDELRKMLDERGVEWRQSANTLGCVFTRWYSPLFGDEVCAMENGEEGLVLFDHYLTPAQAIEATLGRGELERENTKLSERVCELEKEGSAAFYDAAYTNDENRKLRELVEDMLDCIDVQIAFKRVPARWMQDAFAGRARELGIEVEG